MELYIEANHVTFCCVTVLPTVLDLVFTAELEVVATQSTTLFPASSL